MLRVSIPEGPSICTFLHLYVIYTFFLYVRRRTFPTSVLRRSCPGQKGTPGSGFGFHSPLSHIYSLNFIEKCNRPNKMSKFGTYPQGFPFCALSVKYKCVYVGQTMCPFLLSTPVFMYRTRIVGCRHAYLFWTQKNLYNKQKKTLILSFHMCSTYIFRFINDTMLTEHQICKKIYPSLKQIILKRNFFNI